MDMGGRDHSPTAERKAPVARMKPRSQVFQDCDSSSPVQPVEQMAQNDLIASSRSLTLSNSEALARPPIISKVQVLVPDTTRSDPRKVINEPARRWNPWAIPAFVAGTGTVALGLATGTSLIVVVLGVITTLILASIALHRGLKNEWSGKGFAMAAMMIGALAALITLIAVLAGGA